MHRKLTCSLSGGLLALAPAVAAPVVAALAVTALVVTVFPTAAAAAPNVPTPFAAYVRVEGAGATLLPQTLINTSARPTIKGNPCVGGTAAEALDVGTAGNWSGSYSTKFHDYLVSSVLGETPSGNNFWTLFVNGRTASTGACSTQLHAGDHVLWFDCQADTNFNCTNNPLALTAPPIVQRGHRIAAHVTQLDGAGHSTPMSASAVSGRGVSGVSGSGGVATLTPHTAGVITLQATKTGATPSDPVFLCVYTHSRAECGSAGSGPVVRVTGIREHELFARAHAPRELKGSAGPDPSGLLDVSLSLRRRAPNGTCSTYDADRAAFRPIGCSSKAPLFTVGASGVWSYLLPARLAPGRYQLSVVATDGANRKTKLITGRSRIDFTVR